MHCKALSEQKIVVFCKQGVLFALYMCKEYVHLRISLWILNAR